MTPEGLINLTKRTARLGASGNNSDQAASDILSYLNNRRFEIWRYHDWDWSLDDISLTVGPTTYDQTLPSTVGEVTELAIQGSSGILRRYSRHAYLQWQKRPNTADAGDLVGYIYRGRDASGNIKVRFFAAPSESKTIEGWAKKRISALTASDLTTSFAYFPEEMQDLLYKFVLADAYRQMGDTRGDLELRRAYDSLKNLVGEEESQADLEIQTPPPDYLRFVRRARGKGTQVA